MNALPALFEVLSPHSVLLSMWGALLFHWFFPLNFQTFPLLAWPLLAKDLSDKVNHSYDTQKQQTLSGILTLSLLGLTSLVLLIAIKQLVWVSWFFEFLLLWMALGWKSITQITLQVEEALIDENKAQARILLSNILNRETLTLSSIGITKAGCETLLFGYARNLIGVLFWYGIAGGIGARLYTQLVQLTRIWSPRLQKYAFFGLSASALFTVLDFAPSRLFALLIAFGHRFKAASKAMYEQAFTEKRKGGDWLLASCGMKYQVALGGPVIYDNLKIHRPRLGDLITPSPLHLALLNQKLLQKARFWILIQSALMYLAQA